MVTVTDSILANVTLALKKRGMWNRTLVIHLSDNGGPVTTLSPPLPLSSTLWLSLTLERTLMVVRRPSP